MSGLQKIGRLGLGLACLVGALIVTLMATGGSVLIAERPTAPGFGRIEYIAGRSDLPRDGWRLECTYFTGRSLRKTALEIAPCHLPAPASTCPVVTCPLIAGRDGAASFKQPGLM